MFEVYLKAGSFLLFILMGHLLRKHEVFGPEAQRVLAKLNLTITLPAVVIINFSGSSIQASLVLVLFIGFLVDFSLCVLGWAVSRGRDMRMRCTYLINCSGYNIGSFALPYVQSFLPALGTVATCVFDAGNALMCTGGSYALATTLSGADGEKFSLGKIAKRLFSSVTIDTYLLMFLFGVLGIRLPETFLTLIRPAANANVFLAMFMLGLMFHIEFKWQYISQIVKILGLRVLFGAAVAAACWFFLPFPVEVRQALVLMPFSPISSVSPAFTQMAGGDEGLASCVNSVSIILSLVLLTALIGAMGL